MFFKKIKISGEAGRGERQPARNYAKCGQGERG